MSGNRRKARELAMQALFYMDSRGAMNMESLDLFIRSRKPSKQIREFFNQLTQGVMSTLPDLDRILEQFSSHWKVHRMSVVDRNMLRIAVFEMLCCDDIPEKVTINEAIDIGKKYGTDESGSFINGILDSIRLAGERGDATIIKPKRREIVETAQAVAQEKPELKAPKVISSYLLSADIKKRIRPQNNEGESK